MKKRLQITAIITGAVVLLTIAGFWIVSTLAESVSNPLEDADIRYAAAATELSGMQAITLQITKSTEITVLNESYTDASSHTLSYKNMGTEQFQSMMQETLTIGSYQAEISEVFSDGTLYLTVQDSNFSGNITAEELQKRYAPSVLLDSTLYENISGTIQKGIATIIFESPSAAESWALPEGATFVDASGIAYLDVENHLSESQYTVSYTYGSASVQQTVTVDIVDRVAPTIDIPSDQTAYIPLEYLDGPRMLEKMSGYLLQANTVTTDYSEYILCRAFGDERSRKIALNMCGNSPWSARLDTIMTLTNSSRSDEIIQMQQQELFLNDSYSIALDDGTHSPDATVTEEIMRTYCKNLLVSTIMLPQHITGAALTEQEDHYLLTFTASEDFALSISEEAIKNLYQDPTILNSMAADYVTDFLQCYLQINKQTGLPSASGIHYSGTYTIDGLPYPLQFQTNQVYLIPSTTAETTINETQ